MTDHTVAAFVVDVKDLKRMIAEMGGIAEIQSDAVDALQRPCLAPGNKLNARSL